MALLAFPSGQPLLAQTPIANRETGAASADASRLTSAWKSFRRAEDQMRAAEKNREEIEIGNRIGERTVHPKIASQVDLLQKEAEQRLWEFNRLAHDRRSATAVEPDQRQALQQIYEQLVPSAADMGAVVGVFADDASDAAAEKTSGDVAAGNSAESRSSAGTVVSGSDGRQFVVTSLKLIQGRRVRITAGSPGAEQKYAAKVLAADEQRGLALLGIEGDRSFAKSVQLALGDSPIVLERVTSYHFDAAGGGSWAPRIGLRLVAGCIEITDLPESSEPGTGIIDRGGRLCGVCIETDANSQRCLCAGVRAIGDLFQKAGLESPVRADDGFSETDFSGPWFLSTPERVDSTARIDRRPDGTWTFAEMQRFSGAYQRDGNVLKREQSVDNDSSPFAWQILSRDILWLQPPADLPPADPARRGVALRRPRLRDSFPREDDFSKVDFSGEWGVLLRGGFEFTARLDRRPQGRWNLVDARNFSGVYRWDGTALRIEQPLDPRLTGFEWEIVSPDFMILKDSPDPSKTGNDYRGATMRRVRKPPQEQPVAKPGVSGLDPVVPAGQVREDNGLGLKLVWCPPGQFTMGSPHGERDRDKDEQQNQVTLAHGFWLGACEVTQREWTQIMRTEPWKGEKHTRQGENFAATFVSWEDAGLFCWKLTAREREAGRLPAGAAYRLPTEGEWEYACRAGSKTRFSFGDSDQQLGDYAWWGGILGDGNAQEERYAHEVGLKKANYWGLCDMHGNVCEWCQDAKESRRRPGTRPVIPGADPNRVNRGGGWLDYAATCRSAARSGRPQSLRSSDQGFRIVLGPGR